MRKNWLLFGIALLAPLMASANKQVLVSEEQTPQLIELYTSEGCSSCPPADRKIAELVDHPDLWKKVVPMAFHVDYWNYLGWPDRFSQKQFSDRQRNLRATGKVRSVYTPGWLVDGKEWRGFFRRKPLPTPAQRDSGTLTAERNEKDLTVNFTPKSKIKGQVDAHVAILGFDLVTKVKGGENRGKVLEHQFVVLDKQVLSGKNQWQFSLPELVNVTHGKRALVVWVDQPGKRPIQVVADWIK